MKKIILTVLLICLTFTACDSESEIKLQDSLTTKNEESQNLEKLYNDLVVFSAKDAECSGNLDFIAIGKKPCGGPERYIPYSLKIDTAEFLNKVNFYNSKQNEFNEKWNITSTCDVVARPISAACINGKATLLYETDRSAEKQYLETLYNEIIVLSGSNKPCTGNWDFIAIGSKPCGGPEKYIPYSLEINTSDFFTKINLYTTKQMEFNEKWKISSTCDVTPKPQSVDCVDGIATLIY